MRATPMFLLALVFVAGAALACDDRPATATSPQDVAVRPFCSGFSTRATPTEVGWAVNVFIVNGPACEAYGCTILDAEHALSAQQAIVECRRIYGITGPHV
ncbi:MAG TPA: hypothetical protein VMM18_18015 [Gemmatimonadaceae bacterium]|nr:hypothetical protein [Gemmatimonadaceae bacterium]